MGLSRDPDCRELCPATGKARLTKGEAKKKAKRPSRKNGGGMKMSAYKCRSCKGWHVGGERWRLA